jgi:hypothetical protein
MKDIIEIHQKKSGNFVTVSLTCIHDTRLSWRAKGLHTYLISRPPGWKIRRTDLIKRSIDGRDAVSKAIKELKNFNYLYGIHKRNYSGTILSHSFYVLEEPESDIEKLQRSINIFNDSEGRYNIIKNTQKTDNPENGDTGKRETQNTDNPVT